MAVGDIVSGYDGIREKQEALYVDLHQHPELSMEEERTRGIIADKLREFDYDVVEVGGGIVGVLENGDGPTVMLRADFDALPIQEDTGLDYASTVDGVMHACGHDSHVAALMGVAALMKDATDAWSGTLEVLFQPGEETAEGAQSMVDAGVVDKVTKPDVMLGQHVFCSVVPAGSVAIKPGPVLSTATSVTVKVFGAGSHGSMPHLSVDPVVLASSIVMRLQTIVSRELNPSEFGVVTVGSVQAGSKANVIPFDATLKINIRAYDEEVRDKIIAAIERIVKAECEAARSPKEPEFSFSDQCPLTDNDADVTARVREALEEHLGSDRVQDADRFTASEDFSVVADAFGTPYCYWIFGGGKEGEEMPNHSPFFAPVQQPTLQTGTEALITAAYAWLGK
ncbi:amidohydrolase [Corynebacterium confusum]|uniref:amidohydrolase n=1 Tax=Corynebacterium confusum TaxID=71254 RepID=UPI0025B2A4D8|nr:amidohydrolase [Corynebacterium confusum]WJY89152.1 putative hydrolase YxeP [Corynebacterium confusum]